MGLEISYEYLALILSKGKLQVKADASQNSCSLCMVKDPCISQGSSTLLQAVNSFETISV